MSVSSDSAPSRCSIVLTDFEAGASVIWKSSSSLGLCEGEGKFRRAGRCFLLFCLFLLDCRWHSLVDPILTDGLRFLEERLGDCEDCEDCDGSVDCIDRGEGEGEENCDDRSGSECERCGVGGHGLCEISFPTSPLMD